MADVDRVIHQPVRLRIMAAMFAIDADAEVDFTFLRDRLGLTDGNLGAHLERLEEARYIAVRKTFIKRRPKTFIKLSRQGRRAFEDYIEIMKAIIGPE